MSTTNRGSSTAPSGWSLRSILVYSFILFGAFTCGLNLSLHGILSLHSNTQPIQPSEAARTTGSVDSSLVPPGPGPGRDPLTAAPPVEPPSTPPSNPPAPAAASSTIGKSAEAEAPNTDASHIPMQKQASVQEIMETSLHEATYASVAADAASKLASNSAGPISQFITAGKKFPIALLTCNRPDQLKTTIASLLNVRGIAKENIIVIQDGAMEAVAAVAKENGLPLIQNTIGLRLRGGAAADGATRIAMHYRFALTTAFDRNPTAPAIIIVEDDLLFSPDFLEYFERVSPILDADKSLFVISAWNDNGFIGKVLDPLALVRTEFFPGLGWLLPRALYKGELEQSWPEQHWDHWLRSENVHKGREIVHPQVPRTFHNGIKGTFMDQETHNRYFRDIAYNRNLAVTWPDSIPAIGGPDEAEKAPVPVYLPALQNVYEARLQRLLRICENMSSFQQFLDAVGKPIVACIWIRVSPTPPPYQPPAFEPIARFFGLWHEHQRGNHKGVHEFFFHGTYVLLLNTFEPYREPQQKLNRDISYRGFQPPGIPVLEPSAFDKSKLNEALRRNLQLVGLHGSRGQSCDEVCAEKGLSCRQELLPVINSCAALQEAFACAACSQNFGLEQPAFVPGAAGGSTSGDPGPGQCLVTSQPSSSTCSASHQDTIRLCPCT